MFGTAQALQFFTRRRSLRTLGAFTAILAAYLFCTSQLAYANDIPPPAGDTLLTVTGKISNTNSEAGLKFDLAMLEALPMTKFESETPWTDGLVEWEGVRLSDFLDYVGAESDQFEATALDGYEIVFENIDLDKYPVILALRQNGQPMSVRDLGPIWIMFPFADYPELNVHYNRALCIWQLIEMKVL